ncbi:hypothetical protein HK102_001741 [Quaeritorhiza haematococci]|nr:hypothetical protein HK102_001741 [Quaeritorhiza haematococci]
MTNNLRIIPHPVRIFKALRANPFIYRPLCPHRRRVSMRRRRWHIAADDNPVTLSGMLKPGAKRQKPPPEDFLDFFDDNDVQATARRQDNLFHQTDPRPACRLTWGPGCRDHRCSHHCRARWAFKEATILRRHLNTLGDDKHVYFGELVILGSPTAAEHKTFRTRFQKALTALGKKRQGSVTLYATSEVGENLRLHYHYCLVSDFEVKQYAIKKLWTEACDGWRTIVSHGRPRSIDARARYMFKDMWKYRGKVRLLRKGSPRMTWGHLDFYPQGKNADNMKKDNNMTPPQKARANRHETTNQDGFRPRADHYPPSNGTPTSDEAAASIYPHAQRQRDILYAYVCEQYMLGTTNQEAEDALGMPAQTITPRMLELRREGLVVDSGEKRRTRSGRRAVVWIDASAEDYDQEDMKMKMMTFAEYCRYREGLWLNDKNAVVGLSKIAPPEPRKKPKPKPIAPPKIRTVHAPPPKPVGEAQLPDALTMMSQLGINLVEPDKDQLRRLVDKAKKRVIVPQRANLPAVEAGTPAVPGAQSVKRQYPPGTGGA